LQVLAGYGLKGCSGGDRPAGALDLARQIVVDAQPHGTGSEQELLLPVVDATAAQRTAETAIYADAGYHSEKNLGELDKRHIPAWICDNGYRQLAFFRGKRDGGASNTERMKRRIDSDHGKQAIAASFATIEPVFGNLRHNKRLDRVTLRGRTKVDGQWKLYCVVHNIEKLGHHGYAN
jgi:IS5 family transposase